MWILQLRKKLKSKNNTYTNIRENDFPPTHLFLLRSVSQKKGNHSFFSYDSRLSVSISHIYMMHIYFISFPFSHFQVSLYHLHHLYLHQVIFFLLLFVFQVLFVIIPNVYLPLFAIPPFVLHSILLL